MAFKDALAGSPNLGFDRDIAAEQEKAKKDRETRGKSILPAAAFSPSLRDRVVSALMGLQGGLAASRGATDPFTAALSGIAGAAGGPTPQALANQRAQQEAEARLAQLDALPIDEISPGLVQRFPELADMPLAAINKIAPLLQRNEQLESAMARFNLSLEQRQREFEAKQAVKAPKLTKAQESADREFGREYTRYVASGGFADSVSQIGALDGVLSQLEEGRQNLTGPAIGALPDAIRKRTHSASFAAQQAVEQSVQRSLKQTLGGQFTEREGMLFMQRGYDPALPERENAEKLRRMSAQLRTMAQAKQEAIEYFEENGTLVGFRGKVFALRSGQIVEADAAELKKIVGEAPGAPRPIKIGRFKVTVK